MTTQARDTDPPEDRWLTVAEVADLLQLSRKTVLAAIHRGQLPAVRLGRHWRVSSRQLDAALNP